jgi:hypothetical protein
MLFNNSVIKVINLIHRHELNTNQITNFDFINMDMDNKVINDNIFDGNYFNSELLIASIAFTHYNLWKKLIIDDLDYYIILNDDIKLGDRLKENIESLHNIFIDNDINIFESGYTINKIGAIKLLQYIKYNGFKYDLYKMIEIVGNKNLVINNIKDKLAEIKIDNISTKPMNMNDLSLKYKLDKNREYGHDYIPIYEKLFDNIKYNVKNILEIGIGCLERDQMTHMKHLNYRTGNSLRFWRDYFINANVYGCDIIEEALFEDDRIKTFVCDQSNKKSLNELINNIGCKLDIIIDDGSHQLEHQTLSFIELEKHLTDDGIYVIENVFTHYIKNYISLDIFSNEYRQYIKNNYDIYHFDRNSYSKISNNSYLVVFKRRCNKCVYINSDNHYGLGNSMFQIAAGAYYCEKYGYKMFLNENSEWLKYGTGNMFNKNQAKLSYLETIFKDLKKTNKTDDYTEVIYNDCFSLNFSNNNHIDNNKIVISGWSQNAELFYEIKDKLPNYFNFNDKDIDSYLVDKYDINSDDIYIMIGLRLGIDGGFKIGNDYINKYSISKIIDSIVDENKDKKINIFVISDINIVEDIYSVIDSKYNFILINECDIYQFYIGLRCTHFILSESTFHYWIALLASIKNKNKNKVKTYVFDKTSIAQQKYTPKQLLDELNWEIVEAIEDKDFVFINSMDQFDYDIYRIADKSIPILKKIALQDKGCIGFNTLGFFKGKLTELNKSPYYQHYDGMYIKREIYEDYIKNNT